jgi:hypothetical protein
MELLTWKKLDNFILGVVAGVVLPALFYFLFVYPKMSHYSFMTGYYRDIVIKFLPVFLSRCIFPNALLFFFFTWKDHLKIAKGILLSTAVLTALLLFISFIL